MALSLALIALLALSHLHGIVSATTLIHFYTDNACQDLSLTVETNTNAGSGNCGTVNGIDSINPTVVDSGCAVTIYSDGLCSDNPVVAPAGTCTSKGIGSFSVDCPQNNGTLEGYSTLSAAASSQASTLSPWPSSSQTSPQQEPATGIQSTSIPTITSLAPALAPGTTSISIDTGPVSSTTVPSSSASPSSTAPAPAQVSKPNGNAEGGQRHRKIILEAALPSVLVLVIVIFGLLIWRWRHKRWRWGKASDTTGPASQTEDGIARPESFGSETVSRPETLVYQARGSSQARDSFASLPLGQPSF